MRVSRLIIVLAIVAGVASWLVEALIYSVLVGEGGFVDHLMFDIPPAELYHRLLIVLLFVGFGLVIAGMQAAREQEQSFHRAMLDAIGDGLVAVRDDGRIRWVNDTFCEMTGRDPGDLVDLDFTDLAAEGSREAVREVVGEAMEECGPTHEVELAPAADRQLRALIHCVTLDETQCSIGDRVIVVRDITSRRRLEQSERRSEAMLDGLLNATSEIAAIASPDGTIVGANEAFARSLGASRDTLEGANILDYLDEDAANLRRARAEEVIRTRQAVRFEDTRAGRWFDNTLYPIVDEHGEVIHVAVFAHDITERRRDQQALEQQAQIIEQSHDLVVITDLEGNIVDVNRSEEELFGFSRAEFLERTIFDFGDDLSVQHEILDQTIETGSWRGEVVNRTGEGEERILDCRTFILDGEGDEPSRLVGISRDITDRKHAEQQMARALEERRGIMDAMSDVLVFQDLEHQIIMTNRAAAESVGMEPEEMIGGHCYELWAGRDDECDGCPVAETLRTGEPAGWEHETPDGRIWELSSDPVYLDDEMVGVVEIAKDITERKRAEEEVAELSQFRESVIDQANIWVQVTDRENRVLLWNRAAEQMTGYSRDEVLDRDTVWEMLYPDPDYRRQVMQRVTEIIEDGLVVENEETTIRREDGTERIISWNMRRLIGPSGEPIGAVAMGQDITQHRQLEEQLRRATKMEAIGRLAGGIAHDFNNMLTAILGNVQLLLDEERDDRDHRIIEEIRLAANRSADLTEQLLAFGRKQVMKVEVLDLNQIVSDMEPMFSRMISEKIDFTTHLDPDLGAVRADPSQMEQVLMNLVVNAGHAMPDGGTLSVETSNVRLDEDYADVHADIETGDYAMLAVSDTGVGMDEETRTHIFEPFFTTRGDDTGTGLGLSIVYGIVEQSGGHIMVYSEPGEGTTFKVYMPLVEDEVPEQTEEEPMSAVPVRQATILVAEDERAVRMLIVRALENQGHTVIAAGDAEEAIERAGEHTGTIDLMITDVVMPGMSGPDLAEQMAQRRPEMPVLYLSGYTDNTIVHNGVLNDTTNYLQKPFAPEDLLQTVSEILDGER